MIIPNWNEIPDHQKLESLREVVEILDNRLRQQGAWIHDLHSRLAKIEGKEKGAGT